MRNANITFIGGGNMARSLIAGLVQDGYSGKHICVVDRNQPKVDYFIQHYQVQASTDIESGIAFGDIIVLAVKPQTIATVAKQVGKQIQQKSPLFLSIAAGVTCDTLAVYFGAKTPIVRAMPNTPSLVQASATGLFATQYVSMQQKDLAEQILRAVGLTLWVTEEALIDSVTCIAGSAPGYLFAIMESMQQIGVELGLTEKNARLLTAQALLGTAKLAIESGESFSQLRHNVTSKGGTTSEALRVLKERDMHGLLTEALLACQARCQSLAEELSPQAKLPKAE